MVPTAAAGERYSPVALSMVFLLLGLRDFRTRALHDGGVDVFKANQAAWDRAAERGNPYAQPVSAEEVADARQGRWRIRISDTKTLPPDWLGDVVGKRIPV